VAREMREEPGLRSKRPAVVTFPAKKTSELGRDDNPENGRLSAAGDGLLLQGNR
jgi:hypothetical protein